MGKVNAARLINPGVVRVTGEDAEKFLQGLITNDIERLQSEVAIYAGLLSPQAKILFAFFVVKLAPGSFLLETSGNMAAGLAQRLGMYKLRSKVTIEDVSLAYTAAAFWNGSNVHVTQRPPTITYRDARHADIGVRALTPARNGILEEDSIVGSQEDYHAHRIALGVPEAELDYSLGDTFPHEANFDLLDGISFDKGCYVGQEVVSRMQHKMVVRKRIVLVAAETDLPSNRPEIKAGEAVIGRLGSIVGHQGLALIRLDRADEAITSGRPILVGDVAITIDKAALERFRHCRAQRLAPTP
jgi:folate-binding protein YgfZ